MSAATEKCGEQIYDKWGSTPCHRPVKGTLVDGTGACGIHLAAERKRIFNRNEEAQRQAREVAAITMAKHAGARLAALGYAAAPAAGRPGMLVIDHETAAKLADYLERITK